MVGSTVLGSCKSCKRRPYKFNLNDHAKGIGIKKEHIVPLICLLSPFRK